MLAACALLVCHAVCCTQVDLALVCRHRQKLLKKITQRREMLQAMSRQQHSAQLGKLGHLQVRGHPYHHLAGSVFVSSQ